MAMSLKAQYRLGEILVIMDYEVTLHKVLGVYRCRRNLDIDDLLQRFLRKFDVQTEQKFVDFLVEHGALETLPCHEVGIDTTVGLVSGLRDV